jgi:DNA-binding LacI/PurR family transcriptional regulator
MAGHTAGRARPTLADVAARAGVSRQTVSNVINTPDVVRPATRARVAAVIDELGYRPLAAARQLRTRRSQVVGLCLPPVQDGISGEILDRFLHAVTEEAQRSGLRLLLFTAADDAEEIAQYDTLLETADLDGFVLTSTHHGDARARWLTERHVPFVTFGRPWDESGPGSAGDRAPAAAVDHAWVDVDGRTGTRAATEHLLGAGHERVGFVGWPAGSGSGDDRRAGWAEALAAAGLPAGPERRTDDGVAEGARAADALLDEGASALVCVSDALALGALTAVRRRPGAPAAIVGFDDTPVARAVGLSSVAQPVDEVARRAVALLVAQIEGAPAGADAATAAPTDLGAATSDAPDHHVLIPSRLVVRASSAGPEPARGRGRDR